MNNKPKHFLIFKIIGFIGMIIFIIGLILMIKGFGNFESNNYLIGMILFPLGFFVGCSCLIIGFKPEISKIRNKTIKYIQEENKEDIKDITTTTVEIISEAIDEVTKETMYCKHCGKIIEIDSKFCKHCGKNV